MITRQARHNAKVRAERTAAGRCRDCGAETDGYRCPPCNQAKNARQKRSRASLAQHLDRPPGDEPGAR